MPFEFRNEPCLEEAVNYLKDCNQTQRRKMDSHAPTAFLTKRWERHVLSLENGKKTVSKPDYEFAVLSTLNEKVKSGDVTIAGSRRWSSFEDYLIPLESWQQSRTEHYEKLGLPLDAGDFIDQLEQKLTAITRDVDDRTAANSALSIDTAKGTYTLARLRKTAEDECAGELETLIQNHLPNTDLVDVLIDIDNATDFLRHFVSQAVGDSRLPPNTLRRNALAALIAVGCNLGPARMAAAAPDIGEREISRIADWYFHEDALRAATIDLVNFSSDQPISRVWGCGDTCSADGVRFYVPVNILSSDYSAVLQGRGVTMLAHTADNYVQLHQRLIPCRLREATFVLDGLMEHDTELDPQVCFTDTHGYTEVVMAAAHLLGFELAPRIRDVKDQTLYRFSRHNKFNALDQLITGTIRPHLIRQVRIPVISNAYSGANRTRGPDQSNGRCRHWDEGRRWHGGLSGELHLGGLLLATRGTGEMELVRVMYHAVEDCIGDGWLADDLVPVIDLELAGDDGGEGC